MENRSRLLRSLLVAAAVLSGCLNARSGQDLPQVRLPEEEDWTDRGVVIEPGDAWDDRTTGQISPTPAIKFADRFYLYYIGAKGNRESDGGPAYRALGVAVSRDGIHFTRYEDNPILTWTPDHPTNEEEEGVFSAAAHVEEGRVQLYYTALTATGPTSVRADIRRATSTDGLRFADQGEALGNTDAWLPGDDEISASGAFRTRDSTYLYYTTNGGGGWQLGLASGPSSGRFTSSRPALTNAEKTRGGMLFNVSLPRLDADRRAVFMTERKEGSTTLEVRTVSESAPAEMSAPVRTYRFPRFTGGRVHATVLLDRQADTWFLYYLDENDSPDAPIRCMTAPVEYVEGGS